MNLQINLDRATHAKTYRVVLDSENKEWSHPFGGTLGEETAKCNTWWCISYVHI